MFFNNARFLYWLKNGVNFLLFPSQERLSILLKENKNKFDSFANVLNVYQDNIVFKAKLKNYNNFMYKINILEQENKELKNMLNLEQKADNKFVYCKIIGRTIDDWYSAIILDKGQKQGLKVGEIVVSFDKEQKILVGQIVEVYNDNSKVLLITNMNSNILAVIPKRNAYSIVSGDNSKFLKMKNLENCEKVQKGDAVFTSGLGSVFPEGIYVGEIKMVKRDKGSILNILIEPSRQIYALDFVAVIEK